MAEYYNVTTNLGDAEIVNAIATNTKLNITHIAFGDGNGSVPTPNKARTFLVREVHRQAVTKYERHATNANWIVIETIIPSDVGGFTIREMGIIANGKLISHGSHAPFEKVADPSGVSEYRLRFTQNVTDGSVVEITLDESLIYASKAWVEENFIKRTEIVDNLITADPNKPLSANAGKSLQDGKLGKNDNAVSATKLQTARTIGGVSFNGTANINLPGVNAAGNQSTSGNAATATKLATIRSLSFSGDASGRMSFDGSADVSTNLTLSNTGVVAGTYKSVTVDAKGRISAGNDVITGLVTATTATGTANQATSNTNTFLNITEKIGSATTTVGTSTQVTGAGTVSVTSDTTGNITITGAQSITGNAATATKLATIRSLSFSGDASGRMSFDGSADVSTNLTLSNTGVVAGTYKSVTVDAKGRISAGNDVITGLVTATTATGTANQATSNTNTFLNITEKIGSATTTVGTSTQVTGAGTVSVTSDTTGNITITGAQSITGNAATATKLQTARTIAISGAVTGTATGFDGSENIAIATTAIDGSKISSGTVPVARLPAASTSAAGTVQLNNTLTSTSNTQALTAAQGKVLNDQAFGVGQAWLDMTASRALNTVYTNTTGKSIAISVVENGIDGYMELTIAGFIIAKTGNFNAGAANDQNTVFGIVPPMATYQFTTKTLNYSYIKWWELR